MIPPGKWTQLDLARAVACEFAAALKQADPTRYEVLARAAEGIGQGWVVSRPDDVPPGERLSYRQASERFHIPESTLRRWANDPTVPVRRLYGGLDPHEVGAYRASRRTVSQERRDLADQLAGRYRAGASLRDLAEDIDRSPDFVVKLLGEAGVVLRRRGHR